MGPICLGPKSVTLKKRKQIGKRKTERKEEREKKTHMPKFHQQADPTLSMVRSSWNLEERFKTWVATIWTVEIIFWAQQLVLLAMNNNNVFWGILSSIFLVFFAKRDYIIQGYMCSWCILVASRDYSREDKCNPLLLIVEIWTGLGPMVFPFALGGFPRKNSSIWFIFLLHEFIYLLIVVAITYWIFHKEMVEKS